MKRRGVSPVVATVLLIALVLVLAGIIFLWARGFIKEKVEKFGQPVDNACGRVDFDAGIVQDSNNLMLDIDNRGDVPLYGFNVKVLGQGSVRVNQVFDRTLVAGDSDTFDITNDVNVANGEKDFLVVPVILAKTSKGNVAYTCPDTVGKGVTL